MIQYLLMGAKAAGMIADIYGKSKAYQAEKEAINIEKRQIGLRMEQEKLSFLEQSVADVRNLERVLASQRVFAAARGISPGQGTALIRGEESMRAFKADETARNLSQMFLTQQRQGQMQMKDLERKGARQRFQTGLFKTAFESVRGLGASGGADGGSLTLN